MPLTLRLTNSSLFSLATLFFAAGQLLAQEPVEIPDGPTCRECRIVLDRMTTLGTSDGKVALSRYSFVAQDHRGRFYTASPWDALPIAVYDPDGRFLRSIGRAGPGPGEFSYVSAVVVDKADSVHAFGLRYDLFRPDGRLGRSKVVLEGARVWNAFLVGDSAILVQAMPQTPALAGIPLHLVDRNGGLRRSFGLMPDEPVRVNFWTRWRPTTVSPRGEVWLGMVNRYRLELWSLSGQRLRVLERKTSWFEPWQNHSGDVARDRPPPRLLSLRADADGLLWVLIQIADANYKPLYPPDGREHPMYDVRDEARISDTVLEVIDPRTARVIATQRFDGALNWFFADGLVSEVNQNDTDDTEIRVYRVRLQRK